MSTDENNPYASPKPVDDERRDGVDPARAGPAPVDPPSVDPDAARRMLRGPAIALIALACVSVLIDLGMFATFLIGAPMLFRQHGTHEGITAVAVNIVLYGMLLLIHFVVGLGGVKMLRLRTYSNAITAAVVALIPCFTPLVVLGIPFGIWALVVLCRAEVRVAFQASESVK